jgi:hypothetical protein
VSQSVLISTPDGLFAAKRLVNFHNCSVFGSNFATLLKISIVNNLFNFGDILVFSIDYVGHKLDFFAQFASFGVDNAVSISQDQIISN